MTVGPIYLDTSAVLRAWLEAGTSPDVEAQLLAAPVLVTSRLALRCDVWELTREVCDLARTVAPAKPLRARDALHLATFVVARRKIEGLAMLTTEARLAEAAGATPV